jgi:CHAT domain-containing protein
VRARALVGPDAASRWAIQVQNLEEAVSRHDAAAVRQIVAQFPQAAREHAEEKLFGDWAKAELAHRSAEAMRSLDTVRAIGAALVAANGERMVADTVKAIEQAVSSHDSDRLSLLMDGHAVYQEGLGTYAEGRFAEAGKRFARARDALRLAGSPFAGWAVFRLAVAEMQSFHYDRSLLLLDLLRGTGFQSLVGRSLWVEGLIYGIQARPEESLGSYRFALQAFATAHEFENLLVVNSLVGECLRNMGGLSNAWTFHLQALERLGELRDPIRQQLVLEQVGETALTAKLPSSALDFLDEALGNGSPPPVAASFYSLRQRAIAHSQAREFKEAEGDLAEARAVAERVSDEAARKSLLGDLLVTEGSILLQEDDPKSSIVRLGSGIQIYEKTNYWQELAFLYAQRARAYLALDRSGLAEKDFKRAIQLVQDQGSGLSDGTYHASYVEKFRALFGSMVLLQHANHRDDTAFDYAEMGRDQSYLKPMIQDEASAHRLLTSDEIRRQLPEDVAVVEYGIYASRLLVWVARRDSLGIFEVKVSPEELESLVTRVRTEIAQRSRTVALDNDARLLSTRLIGQLQGSIHGAKKLVIVPDQCLYAVPFSALLDPRSGKFLVEAYTLRIVPSANLYLHISKRRRSLEPVAATTVLAMGNPALDKFVMGTLPDLQYAENEARAIAMLYPNSRLVVGGAATKDAFLNGLESFAVVHFAGHAVANPVASLSSFLALAPGSNDSGVVYARDLSRVRHVHARLVVLSACSSLSAETLSGEGVVTLARSLIAAGVLSVAGSLWPVSDRSAEDVMVAFHRYIRSGLDPAAALRQAQIERLARKDPLADWAAFEIIGL